MSYPPAGFRGDPAYPPRGGGGYPMGSQPPPPPGMGGGMGGMGGMPGMGGMGNMMGGMPGMGGMGNMMGGMPGMGGGMSGMGGGMPGMGGGMSGMGMPGMGGGMLGMGGGMPGMGGGMSGMGGPPPGMQGMGGGGAPAAGRPFYICSQMNRSLVLDIAGGDRNPGARVILWGRKSMPEPNQMWTMDQQNCIRSMLNNFMLDASSGSIVMNPCNGNPQQMFMVDNCRIVLKPDPRQCLDIEGGNITEGAHLCLWNYKGSANQHWAIEYV